MSIHWRILTWAIRIEIAPFTKLSNLEIINPISKPQTRNKINAIIESKNRIENFYNTNVTIYK